MSENTKLYAKTVKASAIALGLISCFTSTVSKTSSGTTAHVSSLSPIKINSPLLEMLDGQIDITAIMLIRSKFNELQHGHGRGEKKGIIPFKQGTHTLEEMVQIEQSLGSQKRSNPEYGHLKKALAWTIDESIKISRIYKELRSNNYKDYIVSIIEQWLKQRKKESTLLKSWAKLGENHFASSIQSFATLKSFIDDLQVFLRDIKQSCPKSTEFFDELRKKQQGQI